MEKLQSYQFDKGQIVMAQHLRTSILETDPSMAGPQCNKSPAATTVLTRAMCHSTQFIIAFCVWACEADDPAGFPCKSHTIANNA
ncbi:hypothetical protein DPX16_14538 [Anabarilius grahami]|uniref:Uncharacterized protein n=1 Tax=Anabarilius grahami TaxID=495550 RepID=A0A3N0YXH5_ANAGA|nr:hypothetical protein DPX16_14538 [Anabarilius grahami]